jgi:hypothetical protein
MPLGPSEYTVDSWLNALFNATAFSVANVYLQLHNGDPGAAGTANPGATTLRQGPISMGTPAAPAAGVITISNDVVVQWVGIVGSQDATHYSLWDAATVGNYLGSGLVNANAYTAGDTLTFAIGDIDISLNCAY